MDHQENIFFSLHVNMNKVGTSSMEQKFHQRYYLNIIISVYLSCNQQDQIEIDKARLRLMERKYHLRVLSIFKSWYLKYPQSLKSNRTFELRISNEMWQHIFGSYIYTFLGYVPGLYIFLLEYGNYPLTSKRRRCRNILSIDSRLNRIDPSTNIISPSNAERGYEKKSK